MPTRLTQVRQGPQVAHVPLNLLHEQRGCQRGTALAVRGFGLPSWFQRYRRPPGVH
jgi:hypothetical protein